MLPQQKNGINFTSHRANGCCKYNLKEFTYIFEMGKKNYNYLYHIAENSSERSKIHYLIKNDREVPNAYYGVESDFLNIFHILKKACVKHFKKFL